MKIIRKMTREEMWEEFESQLKCEVRTPITMSYNESINLAEMSIKDVVTRWKKRLEQELCDDAISRQAVLNKAFEIKTGENTSAMVVYAEDIRKESPVLPKREQGEWIEVHPLQEDDGGAYMCSKCRCGHSCIDPDYWKYCPNCGAEMIIKSCSTCKHDGELVCATHGCHNKERYEEK